MTMNRLLLLALLLIPVPALAQEDPPATLSLEEAVALAREHNPEYRALLNDEAVADWGVRSAYGTFLPGASLSGGLRYQGGGQALVGGFTGEDLGLDTTPSYYYSDFSASLGLQLSGADLYRVGQEKASRRAVIAGVDAAAQSLKMTVTRQYLSALRARDAVQLARQELERAEANLRLAEARYAVQSATVLETKQAEVERGRAEVDLLRAEADLETQKLRLLQHVGVDLNRNVELTSEVSVFEPAWELESLVRAAVSAHPDLLAGRASAEAASAGVSMARSAYLPTLSLSAGWSGYTRRAGSDSFLINQAEDRMYDARQQCRDANEILSRLDPPMAPQDCTTFVVTDEMRDGILSQNRQFPFNFETQPPTVSLGISVPIFQGLTRQRQVEAARAQSEDAELRVRAEELRIRADVESAYLNVDAAHRAVQLEERNRELARDQLRLAQERYRVGAASFLELMEAETVMARADRAYLLGVYTFQESLAALEAAVGQDLSIPAN